MSNNLTQSSEDQAKLDEILALRDAHKNCWTALLKRKKPELIAWMNSKTPKLQDPKYTLATKLYWIAHGIEDFLLCPVCHKTKLEKNIDSFEGGYFRACTFECGASSQQKRKKCAETMHKHYGSTCFFTSEAGKKKLEEWCRKNGVENAFQLEEVKEKAAQTRKDHFGYEYTMQSPEKRALASDAYRARTSYSHQFCNPSVQAKAIETKHLRELSRDDVHASSKVANRKNRYKTFLENSEVSPLFTEEDFLKLDQHTQYTTLLKWHCKKCNSDFETFIDQNFSSREHVPVRCLKCHPFSMTAGTSKQEQDLQSFIESIAPDAQMNTKKVISPFELDVYIESKKLAFEHDGLFWHSEEQKDDKIAKQYHLMKTQTCEEKGIQLIHIFEDEWLEKRAIVESRIKNLLGVYDKVIYARKCQVREVDAKTSREFQEKTHIQGSVNAKVSLGLFSDDQLVALMTFGKPRFNKHHDWELLRFSTELNCHVIGGASKLLSYFQKSWHPASLISYADRRWSQGKLYKALGFQLSNISGPNYWYFKSQKRYSRVAFQKHKLKSLLEHFDPSKTEVQNMHENGYHRIFDCGNLVFVKYMEKTNNDTIQIV